MAAHYYIRGIQQVGLGVNNAETSWLWYNKHLGFDCKLFDDTATAPLMKQYTGGEECSRRAKLALNLNGGGGLEIWEHQSKPQAEQIHWTPQSTGLAAIKIRSTDIRATHEYWNKQNLGLSTPIVKRIDGKSMFRAKDPAGVYLEFIEWRESFMNLVSNGMTGGVAGVVVFTSNIERAGTLFSSILGAKPLSPPEDGQIVWPDNNVQQRAIQQILKSNHQPGGPYGKLLGNFEIELVEVAGSSTEPVYDFDERHWGDPGIIHICFDVQQMDELLGQCRKHNFDVTVDSEGKFSMEKASGRFAYIEGPDNILVEFVETYRIPIIKKLGWYINVFNRKKPLPAWILQCMAFNRKRIS